MISALKIEFSNLHASVDVSVGVCGGGLLY